MALDKNNLRDNDKAEELDNLYRSTNFDDFRRPARVRKKVFLGALLIAMIFGFIGGFGGGLASLIFKNVNIPFIGAFNLEQYLPKREITVTTEEKVTVTPDIRVDEVAKALQPQIVEIFLQKSLSQKEKNRNTLDQIYLESEKLGLGFILTSDGWIVSNKQVVSDQSKNKYAVITSDLKVYPVEKLLIDPLTGIAFLKIKADGLPTVQLTNPEYLVLGQEILVFGGRDSLFDVFINQLKYRPVNLKEDLIKSSDEFDECIKLDRGLDVRLNGSPLVNLKGEVVGLLMDNALRGAKQTNQELTEINIETAIPISYFKEAINQVLKEGSIKRPFLGVDYLDLSENAGIIDEPFKNLTAGALIYGAPTKGSPADQMGLRNKDVILKINNDSVNNWYSLTELIQDYAPGSEVELTFLRDGKEGVMKVKLGELKAVAK